MTPTQRTAALRLAESLRYFELDEHELIEAAALLQELAAEPVQARADCPDCQGSGSRDSGGTTPWGEPVYLQCDCSGAPSAEPVQEPVAWRTFDGEGGYDYRTFAGNKTYRDDYIKRNGEKYASWVEPLYAAPQQRKPLTDEQIDAIPFECSFQLMDEDEENERSMAGALRAFARLIEAAHGIKGTP